MRHESHGVSKCVLSQMRVASQHPLDSTRYHTSWPTQRPTTTAISRVQGHHLRDCHHSRTERPAKQTNIQATACTLIMMSAQLEVRPRKPTRDRYLVYRGKKILRTEKDASKMKVHEARCLLKGENQGRCFQDESQPSFEIKNRHDACQDASKVREPSRGPHQKHIYLEACLA